MKNEPFPVSWKFDFNGDYSIDLVGENKFAVRNSRYRLNHDGIWEFEPMNSHRTDEFLARCTFDSLEEATSAYETAKPIWQEDMGK